MAASAGFGAPRALTHEQGPSWRKVETHYLLWSFGAGRLLQVRNRNGLEIWNQLELKRRTSVVGVLMMAITAAHRCTEPRRPRALGVR